MIYSAAMRLGILGPAEGDIAALARRAQVLLDEAQADKVVYLGDDDGMDRVVAAWAHEIVGSDPAEVGAFERAADRCATATPEAIDRFVSRERARLRLKVFVSLPPAPARTVEILDGRVAVFVFDKSQLDEDDIVAASLLVFGKSDAPLVKRVGQRTFFSPGPIALAEAGSGVIDDGRGGIRLELIGAHGRIVQMETLAAAPGRMKIQGG